MACLSAVLAFLLATLVPLLGSWAVWSVVFFWFYRVSDRTKFVRRLLDSENARITITGSSAKLLSREIATCLRGRALTTEVFPLDFREYAAFHGLALPANGSFGAALALR